MALVLNMLGFCFCCSGYNSDGVNDNNSSSFEKDDDWANNWGTEDDWSNQQLTKTSSKSSRKKSQDATSTKKASSQKDAKSNDLWNDDGWGILTEESKATSSSSSSKKSTSKSTSKPAKKSGHAKNSSAEANLIDFDTGDAADHTGWNNSGWDNEVWAENDDEWQSLETNSSSNKKD